MKTDAWFAEALRQQQAGALEAAEPLYRRILDAEPNHADALHLLGVLNHQLGRHTQALDLIDRAIGIDGQPADFHGNRGLVLQALGRLEEAVVAQEQAIARNPGHAGAHFNLGLALVALGDRESAARHYAEAARLSPALADAHLNLGAILQDLGRAEDAIAAHRRAAELLPADPRPWTNLAVSLRSLGRGEDAAKAVEQAMLRGGDAADEAATLAAMAASLHAAGRRDEAARCYAEALRLDQKNHLIINNLGTIFQELGQVGDAESCFNAAIAMKPDFAEPYDNLGTLRARQGRHADAEALHLTALRHRRDLAGAWNNLGNARKAQGRMDAAMPVWRIAAALEPARAETHSNLGNALREGERYAESELRHRRAVQLAPGDAVPNNNYGHALQGRQRFADAALWFRRAIVVNPAYAEAWSNLGLADQRQGDPAAERCYDRALTLRPDLALAHFNKALLRLEAGDLAGGWPGYGWRFASGQVGAGRQPRVPAWRGEDLAGRRLMVWGEQGVGDTILFSALCLDVAAGARSTILEVDRRLVPLFARSFPSVTVRAEAIDPQGREVMAIPDYDRHVPLGSLPRVLRGQLSSFPSRPSWLVPDPERIARWRDRLAGLGPGLRVGIGWRSQFLTVERSGAYVALDAWGPLFANPGVTWVVLQYGDCEAEIADAERRFDIRLNRWDDLSLKDDFDGVAALMANLDLVVSPAMSVGELAGALGVPVWRFGNRDWTQLGSRVRPWFPAMRLFQPHPGEALPDVLARMAADLRALARPKPMPPPALPADPRANARLMDEGLRHHRAGRLVEAEAAYRGILATDSEHPDALHLLGVAAHQRGRNDEAAILIGHAIARRGDVAEYHGNFGSVLQALGRLPEAIASYETALRLRPVHPDALNNLGSALQALGRLPEAEARYRAALAQRPDYPQALANLGTVLHAMGRTNEALTCLGDAVLRDGGAVDARLGQGAVLNDLGRAADAEQQYRAALAIAPDDPDAHAGLGAALFQRGRHGEAAAALAGAIARGVRRAAAYDLLGAIHRLNGDPRSAELRHREAVVLEPERAATRTNLGLALGAQGRVGDAAARHRQALALAPAFPEALNNLGVALQGLGEGEAAARLHRRAIRLRPISAESWGNLAAALLTMTRHHEALPASRRAIALSPALAGALTTGGAARKGLGDFVGAARQHVRALWVAPSHAKAWSNLGTALAGSSLWDDALVAYRRALALAPALPDAHLNLGHAEQVLGHAGAALRCADRTIRLAPGRADARMNRALLRLAAGDFAGGWLDYAARFAAGEAKGRRFSIPEWQGGDLSGRTILVWGEQGLGDEIMFGTTLPDLVERAGRVVVECDDRLVRLFARALPGAIVRAPTIDPRDCDCHAAMGSVASQFRGRLSDFVAGSGREYLAPDPELAAEWRARLAALGAGVRVGLCWRSSRITAERAGAYSRLDQWGPLFALPGLRFVNLQYDDCATELAQARGRFGVDIHGWPDLDLKNDLDAVAALMAGLDLVVTAPTSVGELAAAVGTPVWRLSGPGDWSTLGTRVRPWFGAMSLQGVERGHDDALAIVAERLRRLAPPPAR